MTKSTTKFLVWLSNEKENIRKVFPTLRAAADFLVTRPNITQDERRALGMYLEGCYPTLGGLGSFAGCGLHTVEEV